MYVCAHVYVCVHTGVCVCEGWRSASGVIFKGLSTLVFLQSFMDPIRPAWPSSLESLPVSTSPVLGS